MTKFTGDKFKYFYDGAPCTKETIEKLIGYSTTVTVDNFSVFYVSPKSKKEEFAVLHKICMEQLDGLLGNEYQIQSTYSKLEDTSISAKKDGIKELLKEVDEHQKQNGGRETSNEFPFDAVLTPTREECGRSGRYFEREVREKKIIEDWNKFIVGDKEKAFIEVRDHADIPIIVTLNKNQDEKIGTKKIGQKHNKLKAPLDILQTRQFPKALQLLALATSYGHQKYLETDATYMNFKNVEGGSQTYLDASSRHSTDRFGTDKESKLPHFIHAVWNQLAALQLWAEENEIDIEEFSKDYLKHLEVSK